MATGRVKPCNNPHQMFRCQIPWAISSSEDSRRPWLSHLLRGVDTQETSVFSTMRMFKGIFLLEPFFLKLIRVFSVVGLAVNSDLLRLIAVNSS